MLEKYFDHVEEPGTNPGEELVRRSYPVIKKTAPQQERRNATFFDVVGATLGINNTEQFCAWMQGDLQHIFPHGMMACAISRIENLGGRVQELITCNFPPEYIQALQQPDGWTSSPIIAQWAKTRKPVLFELNAQHGDSAWLENFKRFNLKNTAAHGLCDLHSNTTSYFAFAQIPHSLTERHAALLEMLVPHLHVALTRAINGGKNSSPKTESLRLTVREYQILQCMNAGKSNGEIGLELKISESTVKNHIHSILVKLDVKTRAQAIAKGLLAA